RVAVHYLVAERGVQLVQPVPLGDLAGREVLGEVGGFEGEDGLAHLRVLPVGVVPVGGVEVVLQQLAVAHADGLGDHVGVRVLGDGGVDQARGGLGGAV